ncbi:MAG: HEAT repeat domain-containing protein [Planctomycetota bacterium]|nr:HEAT repeat domain-containing protein [Planctomycetota bacterium]
MNPFFSGATLLTVALLLAVPRPHGSVFVPPEPYLGPIGDSTGSTAPGTTSSGGPTAPGLGAGGTGPGLAGIGSGGPATRAGSTSTVDRTAWEWWWELNKEPYLDLKGHVHAPLPITSGTSGDGFFLGRGERGREEASYRPTDADIHGRIVPALLRTLEHESNPDVIGSTLIAVARIGEDQSDDGRPYYGEVLRRFLDHPNQEVSEVAVLALGILGAESNAPLLAGLLRDTKEGRRASGEHEVTVRTRTFAAYALGLLAHRSANEDVSRYAVHQLVLALEADDTASSDLGVACVLALGLVPVADVAGEATSPPTSSLRAEIETLRAVLVDRKRTDLVRAQVPIALGRLWRHAGPSREELKAVLSKDFLGALHPRSKAPRELVQSSVIALGMLGDLDDDDVDVAIRKGLIEIDRSVSDRGARNLARISLGRIAGRAEAASIQDDEITRHLLMDLAKGRAHERPWAALALGVSGHARLVAAAAPTGTAPTAPTAIDSLRHSLAAAAAPSELGACSIALGLFADLPSEERLRDLLESGRHDAVRGYAATGLGLMDAVGAIAAIRRLVDQSLYRPGLLKKAGVALSLLGDRGAAPAVAEHLRQAKGLASRASAAAALGRIGDARSVDPLLEMLADSGAPSGERSFAAVALGLVADKDRLPWNTPLAVDANYLAAPPTLYDDAGNGVLNIL